jgi:nucleoside 2-deoxyribosyltransferase
MAKVFLSHSARDRELAAQIARELREHGLEALVGPESAHGHDLRQTVKSAIRRADAFVLVLSVPDTAISSWASYELGMAEALGKPILLLLSHNHAVDQPPFELSDLPIVAFDPRQPTRASREIADRLLALA